MRRAMRSVTAAVLVLGACRPGARVATAGLVPSDVVRVFVTTGDRAKLLSREPDRSARLPLLRQATAINPQLRLIASPWSAPGWMKTTDDLVGGSLRRDAFGPFAWYLLRIIQAYASEGIPLFAVTVQNEPAFEPKDYPGMLIDATARAELIGRHVGPLFAAAGSSTRILEWDHNWDAPAQPLAVLGDTIARRFVSGVAWHCYAGDVRAQDLVHTAHRDKDVYVTECSGGAWAPVFADNLQWLVRTLVIGATRAGARGVALWNLALDEHGGPHLGGCGNCRGHAEPAGRRRGDVRMAVTSLRRSTIPAPADHLPT